MIDLISKQKVLNKFQTLCDACGKDKQYKGVMCRCCALDDAIMIVDEMEPAEEPEIIRCADCKWWITDEEIYPNGYCNAIKHGYISKHWSIMIRRVYQKDFFCADAEPKGDEDED